ncbi:hypothetical protein M408DRAFT_332408, partial [Serendipita vermifera MAFF 305830]
MSVAQDETVVHHRAYGSSPTPNSKEYGLASILNNGNGNGATVVSDGGPRRSTPLAAPPAAALPTPSNRPVEGISDHTAPNYYHNPNDPTTTTATIPPTTASPSNPPSVNDPPKMRAAPHSAEAVRVPSPAAPAPATAVSASGSPVPTDLKPSSETSAAVTKDVSPVPTSSTSSTTATATADEMPFHQSGKTRPTLTAPASPPPSPPGAAGAMGAVGATTTSTATAVMVDSPQGLSSSTAPQSTTPTPVRGGSLASLIHSTHREVDVPESSASVTSEQQRREMHGGTPLSPTSMSHGTHSRKDSAATMASASASTPGGAATTTTTTSAGGLDSPLKGPRESGAGDPMDIDPPTSTRPAGELGGTSTPTGLGGRAPTMASLPYHHPSRSPLARPHSATAVLSSSSLVGGGSGNVQSSQPQPHRAQASPTPTPTSSSQQPHTHAPKAGYPSATHAGTTPTATASSHQRRHSLSRPASHVHTRSHSGRLVGTPTNSTATSIAGAVAPGGGGPSSASGPLSQPQPAPQPRPLSPDSHIPGFKLSEASAASVAAGGGDERDSEFTRMRTVDYKELRNRLDQLSSQNEELYAEREHAARQMNIENKRRAALARDVNDWIRSGENLLRSFADSLTMPTPTFNGRGHALDSAGGVSLSSGMVYDRLPREKTLSVVMPATPSTHGRPGSGYGAGHDGYPMHHSAPPTHSESAMHYSRSAAGQAPRPTHNSSNSQSLRRSRRPSSDDLAEIHGGKRVKANNGTFIRTSPDASERTGFASHSGPASASSSSHPLSRMIGAGEYTSYPTSHHRASGSLGSGFEHGRDSPLNRRMMVGREDDEDEFPSPRRTFVAPTSAQTVIGNGHISNLAASRTGHVRDARVTALAGDDADAIGSPDGDTTVHESLMEMVDEEDQDGARPMRGLRHVRGVGMRNGSRSSINSQDIDDMLAEVVDDESVRRGNGSLRSSAKPRYRSNLSGTAQAGGGTSTFPIHLGGHSEAHSPGQTRSYTPSSQPPSKFAPVPSASPVPQPSNSRGFVFRNTDAADMEAQAQARSPEDLGHRPSLSGSGSFNGAQTSPPGTSGNPVTTQFLPPQSGPPQPKKIYHSKVTGQVIGSQHSSMMNPSPSAPVESSQPSRAVQPTSSFTIDGLPKRTCKQCGQPGRYKDNKCVEKWGPGPQGPGTVCDRCRKKMKRVEKRATQDSAAMNAALSHHQYPIAPAPSGSFTTQ